MTELTYSDDITQMSAAYSYIGHRFLLGDVESAKFLYGNAWKDSQPLIETISQLQLCLTAVEIEKDSTGVYCDEFLYYWGMIAIGEVSRLIAKDLGTAKICFERIIKNIPKAEARLSFIGLLLSEEPNKSENNVRRLDVLRKWASKKDFFSCIVLSKIIFYQFLEEKQEENYEPPIRALRLLSLPCQKGHPVAIKFFRAMIESLTDAHMPDFFGGCVDNFHENVDVLYDYKNRVQICK